MEEIKKEGFFTRLGKSLKYRGRKTLIAIYHNPYTVVLLLSAVSMMYFTFNSQKISFQLTEGLLSGIANGFFVFMWTICAYLSVVSYLFYSGKKKNWIMYGVFMIMEIAQLYAAIFYTNEGKIALAERLAEAPNTEAAKIVAAEKTIATFQTSMVIIIFVIVCAIAVIFLDAWFKKQRKAKYEAKKAAKAQG